MNQAELIQLSHQRANELSFFISQLLGKDCEVTGVSDLSNARLDMWSIVIDKRIELRFNFVKHKLYFGKNSIEVEDWDNFCQMFLPELATSSEIFKRLMATGIELNSAQKKLFKRPFNINLLTYDSKTYGGQNQCTILGPISKLDSTLLEQAWKTIDPHGDFKSNINGSDKYCHFYSSHPIQSVERWIRTIVTRYYPNAKIN